MTLVAAEAVEIVVVGACRSSSVSALAPSVPGSAVEAAGFGAQGIDGVGQHDRAGGGAVAGPDLGAVHTVIGVERHARAVRLDVEDTAIGDARRDVEHHMRAGA